jgi:beta propeller repeat protein
MGDDKMKVLITIGLAAVLCLGLVSSVLGIAVVENSSFEDTEVDQSLDKLNRIALQDGIPVFERNLSGEHYEVSCHAPREIRTCDDPEFEYVAQSPYYTVYFNKDTMRMSVHDRWVEFTLPEQDLGKTMNATALAQDNSFSVFNVFESVDLSYTVEDSLLKGIFTLMIYGYNFTTKEEFQITKDMHDQSGPAIYEDIVVWTDIIGDIWDIYGYDLSKKEGFQILTVPSHRIGPAIYKDAIVWQDSRNYNADIYGCTLQTIKLAAEADSLLDKGKKEYENNNYLRALEYLEQAKEIYQSIESMKAAECDEWIDKTQTKINADPDLLVDQAETFLSKDMKDHAINAYKRAADLYEEQGDLSQSQEIKEKIYNLENPPETVSPPTLFSDLRFILPLLALAGILGTLIIYYRIKRRT